MIPSAEPQSERGEAYEVVAFDLRRPGLLKRLISQGAAWRGRAHIELLDPHHAVLVVRAGGAPSERGGPREAKGPAPVGVLALRRARWQAHQSPVLVGDRPARPLRRPRDVGHAQRGPRSRPQGRLRRRGFRLHCRRPLLWRGLDGCVDPRLARSPPGRRRSSTSSTPTRSSPRAAGACTSSPGPSCRLVADARGGWRCTTGAVSSL